MQTSKYTQPWMFLKKKFNVGQQQSIACGSIHFWQAQNGSLFMVECGLEIWPFKIQKQWNLDFWKAYVKETSFEGSSYSCGHDYLKTGFKWSMTIWWPFVRISNAQIPFEIRLLFDCLKSEHVRISDPHFNVGSFFKTKNCFDLNFAMNRT